MPFKKLIIIMSISFTVIICGLLGLSYAWYAVATDETQFNVTTGSSDGIDVVYTQTEYINNSKGVPVKSSSAGDKNVFSVTVGEELSSYEVGIAISLVDISIASELKIPEFRYELYSDDSSTPIASGNFSEIGTNTTIDLTNMMILDVGTHTYELRVWLQDTGVSQNSLMNKSFSAKIKVASAYRK